MRGWGKWLIKNRKEVIPLSLHFLSENWFFYNKNYGQFGIAVDNDDSFDGIDIIATVLDDKNAERKFENAALISKSPQMFRLLIQSLKFINDKKLKDEIYSVLSSVFNPIPN